MTDKDPLRAVMLRAAAHVLLRVEAGATEDEPPPQTVADDRWEVRVEVRRRPAAGSGRGDGRMAAGPHLTRLDRLILAAAVGAAQTMGRLARACDHDTDSYFRERVRRLAREGLLVREGDGYRLP